MAGGPGGAGGGGQGSNGTTPAVGGDGTTNTGSGGGAGGYPDTRGGNGGSGVVIIRYPNNFANATSTTGSPTFTNTGGYKIYAFTASGSITF
jgi:hypothetical protein